MVFAVVVSVLNAKNDSLIYDEDAHIPAGYSYLKKFDMRLNPEHPPLIKDISSFPLLFIDLNFDTSKDFWNQNPNDAQWNAGKEFLFNSGNNPDQIIFWSRIPIIALFIILGIFIFKWTRLLSGIGAGLLALILYTFDPNILGHNHFVTTDLGIAAFITFSFYYFLKFIKDPIWKNVFIFAIFLALVQLTKFSSVLIFPIFGMVLIIYSLIKLARSKRENTFGFKMKNFGEYFGKFIISFGISLIIVWIAYFFTTANMPKEKLPEIVNYYFNKDNTQTIYAKKAIFSMNESDALRPMAAYLFGVARVFQRVAGGNVTYFLGEVSTQGYFSYFPIVFLIKEPLPILLLIFLTLSIFFFKAFQKARSASKDKKSKLSTKISAYIRIRIIEISMISFIVLYLTTSILGRLNIGLRHLFPIFPFIYILVSKTIFDFIKDLKNRKEEFSAYLFVGILSLILIFNTILAYPSYTSYFNELAGGPKNGYRFVTDSNADWGQDLKRLKNWIQEYNHCSMQKSPDACAGYKYPIEYGKPIQKIRVDYFGMADLKYYLGESVIPWWRDKRPIEPGWYAISTLFLQESIYDRRKANNQSYRWLKNRKPDYQAGTSILIYNISSEEAEKANKVFFFLSLFLSSFFISSTGF